VDDWDPVFQRKLEPERQYVFCGAVRVTSFFGPLLENTDIILMNTRTECPLDPELPDDVVP
jgi:hypothetical protein